jgi:hypothetical protein
LYAWLCNCILESIVVRMFVQLRQMYHSNSQIGQRAFEHQASYFSSSFGGGFNILPVVISPKKHLGQIRISVGALPKSSLGCMVGEVITPLLFVLQMILLLVVTL